MSETASCLKFKISKSLSIFGVLALAGCILGVAFEWMNLANGALVAAIGFGCLFFANIGVLRKFSVSVLRAFELRAETQTVIQEAKDATGDLKLLGLETGRELYKIVVAGTRYGGTGETSDEQFDRSESIIQLMERIGADEVEIHRIRESVKTWVVIDYASAISKLLDRRRSSESNDVWNAFWKHWGSGFERPDADQYREWIVENGWLDDEVEAWLQDYEHYRRTSLHRRPEVFRNRTEIWRRPKAD